MTRRLSAVVFSLVLGACGGDGPVAPPTPPPPPAPAAPTTPVVTAPPRLKAGLIGTASIPAQAGATYSWTITGGEILSGAGTTEISFRSVTAGPIVLSAKVTNSAGTASTPGEATVKSFTTLTTILSSNVNGSPAKGVTEYEGPSEVAYAFTPGVGAATVAVEVDGARMGAAEGKFTMDKHRIVWAYGQPATGTSFSDMIVVPSDPGAIPDLAFYSARPAATVRVNDPYCGVKQPTTAFPKSYLGTFPLPEVRNAPLAAETQRGVSVKDYWAYVNNNPTTNDGCSADWHDAVDETIRRVKAIGSDYVAIYQNAYLEDVDAAKLKFTCINNQGCPSWAQIPDSEILWAAERARAHGLKLYLYVQVDVHDIQRKSLPTTPTSEWLNRYYDAYREYMIHLGKLAEQAKIPVMQVDWGVWWIDWTKPEYKPIYQARMTEVAAEVRKVYSGKRAIGVLSPWASDSDALMAQVELVIVDLWSVYMRIDAQENANLTPALVRTKTDEVIKMFGNTLAKYQKPAIFRVQIQSHRNYLDTGWVEDGFCTNNCEQRQLQTDFSVQAIGYQGQLEAIKSQTTFPVGAVEAIGYWFADVILPKESFPNTSQSIRNKPAEALLHHWFKR